MVCNDFKLCKKDISKNIMLLFLVKTSVTPCIFEYNIISLIFLSKTCVLIINIQYIILDLMAQNIKFNYNMLYILMHNIIIVSGLIVITMYFSDNNRTCY